MSDASDISKSSTMQEDEVAVSSENSSLQKSEEVGLDMDADAKLHTSAEEAGSMDMSGRKTSLLRQTAQCLPLPGARAVAGPGSMEMDTTDSSSSLDRTEAEDDLEAPSTPQTSVEMDTVITATLVQEDEHSANGSSRRSSISGNPLILVKAELADEDRDDTETTHSMESRNWKASQPLPTRHHRLLYFVVAVSILVITGLSVGLVLALKSDGQTAVEFSEKKKYNLQGGTPSYGGDRGRGSFASRSGSRGKSSSSQSGEDGDEDSSSDSGDGGNKDSSSDSGDEYSGLDSNEDGY